MWMTVIDLNVNWLLRYSPWFIPGLNSTVLYHCEPKPIALFNTTSNMPQKSRKCSSPAVHRV